MTTNKVYPTIAQVSSFRTSDDKIFATWQEALQHQALLNLTEYIRNYGVSLLDTEDDLARWIVDEWKSLKKIMGEEV